jgi:hypothetical protein
MSMKYSLLLMIFSLIMVAIDLFIIGKYSPDPLILMCSSIIVGEIEDLKDKR